MMCTLGMDILPLVPFTLSEHTHAHTQSALAIVDAHRGKSAGLHLIVLHKKFIYWWI